MKKVLVVIDMQNDFIDGSLGTAEACAIVDAVVDKISGYADDPDGLVFATRDTHEANYLDTQEGRMLPVEHCIRGTDGWQINSRVAAALDKADAVILDKPTFGSVALAEKISGICAEEDTEIEIIGLCTDICVVSNALILKANMPEIRISVDPACCAGVTPEKHAAALETMRSCQMVITE